MKIFICGANGRMGKEIQTLIVEGESLQFVGGFDRKAEGSVVNSFKGASTDADVVIDFSLPEVFDSVLSWCQSNGLPLVSGTTGLSDQQKQSLEVVAKDIPLLWSANMSPGVHVMKHILETMKLLPDFDIQMTESHHIHKKDKPSGTAIMLQDVLKERKAEAPEPLSIRGGGIFGVHRVDFMAPEEVLRIEHEALSRRVFARGALKAAQWLVQQKPGQYGMDDVVKSW